MDELNAGYDVGYGKPPKASQFAKGNSGNPRGRPKGSKTLTTLVLKESRQPVRISGPNGTRTVSKLQAVIMQLGNKSAQGDLRASREFLTLIQRSEENMTAALNSDGLPEADQKMLHNLQNRLAALSQSTELKEVK
jgi:hypothetical protein